MATGRNSISDRYSYDVDADGVILYDDVTDRDVYFQDEDEVDTFYDSLERIDDKARNDDDVQRMAFEELSPYFESVKNRSMRFTKRLNEETSNVDASEVFEFLYDEISPRTTDALIKREIERRWGSEIADLVMKVLENYARVYQINKDSLEMERDQF